MAQRILSIILTVSMLFSVSGFVLAKERADVTLIGGQFGNLETVSVTDCAELDSAYELDLTKTPDAGGFGIELDTAQFNLEAGSVYVLSFYSKLEKTFDTLTVTTEDLNQNKITGFTYQLAGQWTKICFSFTATGNENSIKMILGGKIQKVYIGKIDVSLYDGEYNDAPGGYFMAESDEWETVEINKKDGLGVGSCMDVKAIGDYVYAIAGGRLCVFDTSSGSPVLTGQTEKYGDLRQMSVTDDEKGIIVTARTNEVLAFDITNPAEPVLASRLDCLEAASGLDVCGKYCYIADRILGVSIFDISDLYNPVMVSSIPTGETQDCKVYNGYLYAGTWGSCAVKVCDVRDIDNPKQVGYISLKGRGDGINIKNGYLYAATGHMENGVTQKDPGYATGNGMEIYDISDPLNPVLLSRVRAEGRMYISSPDIWRVDIAGNCAYLSSTYNGIYVYDITNKNLPKRLAHIDVCIKKGEEGFVEPSKRAAWAYPYDITNHSHGALIDCDVKDGKMYIANASNDLYVLENKSYIADAVDKNDSTVFSNENYNKTYYNNDIDSLGLKNAKLFKDENQIWSMVRYGNYTYAAAGSGGIYVIDDDMNLVKKYASHDITNDIAIYENKLYTAENAAGVFVYEIDVNAPENIECVGSYAGIKPVPVVEIALSPDAKYALVQRSNNSALLNVSDIKNITLYKNFNYGMVYQNQLTRKCADNRYLTVFANGNKTVVLDFGENGSYAAPVINESWTSGVSQTNGVCADDKIMFAVNGADIYSFDPADENLYSAPLSSNTQSESLKKFQVSGINGGTPTVVGDYAFICQRRSGQISALKLSEDRSSASLVWQKTLKANPLRITSEGRRVYVPCGYGGLLSFEVEGLADNYSNLSSLLYSVDGGEKTVVKGFNKTDFGREYEIEVLKSCKKIEIFADAAEKDSSVTIENNGIIDLENGQNRLSISVKNGTDTSVYTIKVKTIAFENAKTYSVPSHEDITMQIEVNPVITAVRADSGVNMIYPGETVLNGAKFYSDREDTAMVYLDIGDNLKDTTPILNPLADSRTASRHPNAVGDEYYYKFTADRSGTVIIKSQYPLAQYVKDSEWNTVTDANYAGSDKSVFTDYVWDKKSSIVPADYVYENSAQYPYYCTMYQYAYSSQNGAQKYFAYFTITYYKHFEAGEIVTVNRQNVGTNHNLITLIDWDEIVNVTISTNGSYVTIDGENAGKSARRDYAEGKTIKLNAEDDTGFMYWKDADSGEILSYDKEFDFTVDKARNITAVFDGKEKLKNAKTYSVPSHEDITVQIEVNPLITAVRADEGEDMIYPGAPVSDGSKVYTDINLKSNKMVYVDMGERLKYTTPVINPNKDARRTERQQSTVGDEYYYRFTADRAGTVIVKSPYYVAAYAKDPLWTTVNNSDYQGSDKTDFLSFVIDENENTIPPTYNYTKSSDYPYYCTVYQYAANSTNISHNFSKFQQSYYRHFEAGEIVTITRKGTGTQYNLVTFIDWDNQNTSTITLSTTGDSITVDGENAGNTITKDYPLGKTLALSAIGEGTFMYWKDADSGLIVSYDKDYEFTVGSARKLIAIFAEKDGAYVTFKNINGFVMAEGLASDLTVPQDPYVYGYEFKGWYKDGEISEYKAGAKVTDEQSAQYVAGYGKKETVYKITVNGEEKTYSYNDKVTVVAEAEKDGKTFSYWTKDGKAASYDKEYSFFASADSVLEAVYGENAENKNVLIMANPVMADETRIAFFAERNISSDCEIIETGILMGKAENLSVESAAIKAVAKSKAQKGQYTVRKANVNMGETWYAKAYVIYRDSTGSAQTIYSNEVSMTVN